LNKQHAYNRIAKATIKALKEQAEQGKVNTMTTEVVYQAIEQAFSEEYSKLFSNIEDSKTALEFIAQGENLEKQQMISLAQQALTKIA
jgi:hypothetical protein